MGDIRSRIQASVKWSSMRKRDDPPEIQVERRARVLQAQPVISATPRKRGRPRKSDIIDTIITNSNGEEERVKGAAKEGAKHSEPAASNPTPKKPRKSRLSRKRTPEPEPEPEPEKDIVDEPSTDLSPQKKKKRRRPRKSENLEVEQPDEHHTLKNAQEDSQGLDQDEVLGPAQEDESPQDNLQKDSPREENLPEKTLPEEDPEEESLQEESPGEESTHPQAVGLEEENNSQEDDEMTGEDKVEPVMTTNDQPAEEPDDSKNTTEPGVDQMLWGDKYDLISKLQERRDEDETEEDIDWQEVAKGGVWAPQTLQSALQQLVQLLRDQGKDVDEDDLPGTVDDIMDMICNKHADELEDHYVSSQGGAP